MMTKKTIHLFKDAGNLVAQENTALFRLGIILEDFVFGHENDSRYSEEVALAKRLDAFILSDELQYFDK